MDQDSLNSSAHVPVRAKTNLIMKQNSLNNSTSKKKTILKWEETDTENYQQKINQVRQKPEMQNETDVEQQSINIIDIPQEASKMSVVMKIVSLKGPKWKASPKTGEIPKVFKTGIMTPVHKKGKDSTLTTNYRGITVTSALGKIFEYAILDKMTELNNNQSELQFGFTKGLSPIMAALLVSEGIVHAKQQDMTMFLATLDSQKAFDVVHHMILLEKLFCEVPLDICKVVKDLYSNMSLKIKWNNYISKQFPIHQGVRQGGVLSTHLYKLYINDLPEEL
ncbi:unnamed protein product [Mytilus coruscus]|uniref:Reverse transcriptase domain-containing protein n=1 Tax=Mytilus coruscus TaxID=42192 RepID=A0A6J8A8S9_MYTCO|nr:unnamed protein product [Mytilus coruscus]